MNVPAFQDEISSSAGSLNVALRGEIDIAAEEAVVARVDAAIAQSDASEMVLDLRGVSFMDSSGLRAVLRCQRLAERAGVRFRVAVVEGPITRLFAVAGVTKWFERG